jgi:hypothetical protein
MDKSMPFSPRQFLSHCNSDGGIPYSPGMSSFSEPTLLMILAFIAAQEAHSAQQLVEWVLKHRNSNGSIGLSGEFPNEGLWNTPLLAIVMHNLGLKAEMDAAIEFIIKARSITQKRSPNNEMNAQLLGWSWVANTFGWVEPTSWALLALSIAGKENHPRSVEGRKLLEDRSIPEGGWNYGNKVVFNHHLMPFWDTTALALLALGESNQSLTNRNLDLLERSLPEIQSLYSNALSGICLERFGRNTREIRNRIIMLFESDEIKTLNMAHSALGVIALSQAKVLTS